MRISCRQESRRRRRCFSRSPLPDSDRCTSDQKKRDYLNFYGNLMKQSDAYLVQILDTLEAQG